jgi:hypothetical protein
MLCRGVAAVPVRMAPARLTVPDYPDEEEDIAHV